MRATEFLIERTPAITKIKADNNPKLIDQHPMDQFTPIQLRTQIIGKIREISDREDLVDILKMANKYQFKSDVADFSAIRDYKKHVSDVILTAVGNSSATPEQIRSFLKKLEKDGVINEAELLKPGQIHSLEQIILQEYLPIFNSIKMDIFSKISGKIGEQGDIGKGEYLFSILSPKIVRRGAPGDLDILGKKVELKAGKNGRLGPAGSISLTGRFGEFIEKCLKAKLINPKINYNKLDETNYNLNIKLQGFASLFGGDTAKLKAGLEIALKMHYPSINVKQAVNRVVVGNTINGYALRAEMVSMAYSTYQAAKGFDGVLVLDETVSRYLYLNTPENAKASDPLLKIAWPGWKGQSDCIKVTLISGAPKKRGAR